MDTSILTLSSKIQQDKGLVCSTINDEVVMLSIELGKYFGLDRVGSLIWESISAPTLVSDVVLQMSDMFDTGHQTCEKDVIEFLEDMIEKKIVRIVP